MFIIDELAMYNCPKGMNKVVLYCIVLYCIVLYCINCKRPACLVESDCLKSGAGGNLSPVM